MSGSKGRGGFDGTVFTRGRNVLVDAVFFKQDLLDYADGKLRERFMVKEGIRRIPLGKDEAPNDVPARITRVKIWQLKPDVPIGMRYVTLFGRNERGFGSPKKDEYRTVWEGRMEKHDLEDLGERLARCTPADFGGHFLSVSDVVELTVDEESRFFYAEAEGFVEIEFS